MMADVLQKVWWVVRGCLVLLNNLYCIPTYVVWMILLRPLLLFAPTLYWELEGMVFHWLLTMVAFWSHSAHYRIVETGDSIDEIVDEETLVLVNHQSTSDVPLLMAAFASRPSLLPRLNWIMDAVFKYTNFGVVSALHGDFFINAGRNLRDDSINALVNYLSEVWVPKERKWLVLFPEGGFLRKRKETSNRYCKKMGLAELEHVTLPRLGALHAIIDSIGPKIKKISQREYRVTYNTKTSELKWIVDMTIAYPNGEPLDLVAIVTGCAPPCEVHFHYRIYPIHKVPLERAALQKWLYTRYQEKESVLGRYYQSGDWVSKGTPPDYVFQPYPPRPQSPTPRQEAAATATAVVPTPPPSPARSTTSSPHQYLEDGAWTPPLRESPATTTLHFQSNHQHEDGGVGPTASTTSIATTVEEEVLPGEEEESPGTTPRLVEQDLFRVLLLHLFFITSTLTHIVLFSKFATRCFSVATPPL